MLTEFVKDRNWTYSFEIENLQIHSSQEEESFSLNIIFRFATKNLEAIVYEITYRDNPKTFDEGYFASYVTDYRAPEEIFDKQLLSYLDHIFNYYTNGDDKNIDQDLSKAIELLNDKTNFMQEFDVLLPMLKSTITKVLTHS